ncbi:substrate-binding protein [Cryptosporangium japonicum]|uniref:Urea ABC transporter substrate-binding protein n=1 Tax=Cryptosporangium japonicum TaxID=80872 RepID=A0ABP3DJX4_9ACTN
MSTGFSRRALLKAGLAGASALAAPSLLTACAPKSTSTGSSSGPIKVGVLSPLSGAWTVYGKAHSAGFRLAVDEINAAGGTLGRRWEVVLADTKTEPQVVTEQANRLVREERVDFLAGTFSSAERNAAGPVATNADKLLLYPTFYEGQSQQYHPGVCNPNVFMFGPEPTEQVWPHLEYVVKKHGGKFFLIGSDYVWPRETNRLTKQKLTELGGSVVGEVYVPFNTPQYGAVIDQIRRARAQVVFLSLTGSDTVNFRRQLAASGAKKDLVVWTVDDEEAATTGVGPDATAGDYVSFDYFWSIDTPNNRKFRAAVTKKYPDVIMSTVGVAMYNAAHLAALAIEKAGSVGTDEVRRALEGLTFDGAPQGPVTMRALDHQAVLPSYLAQVRPGWTGPDDMFTVVHQVAKVEPATAQCETLPLAKS